MEHQKPEPTGKTALFDLTGMLMPWVTGMNRPATFAFPDDEHIYIPVWESETDLRDFMTCTNADFDTIKVVDDSPGLLARHDLQAWHEYQLPMQHLVNRRTRQNRLPPPLSDCRARYTSSPRYPRECRYL